MDNFTAKKEALSKFGSVLFQYPYWFPPTTIRRFIVEIHEQLEQLFKSDPDAVQHFDQKARERGVLKYKKDGKWNWGAAFTPQQIAVLENFYHQHQNPVEKRKMKFHFDSVTSLCKAFRHKCVHFRDIPDLAKTNLIGQHVLVKDFDQVYVSFWLAKFPDLLLLFWLQFKKIAVGSSWSEYFPPDPEIFTEIWGLQNIRVQCPCNLGGFANRMQEYLLKTKSYGMLMGRYKCQNLETQVTKSLEYRHLSHEDLYMVISKGNSVTAFFQENKIVIEWNDRNVTLEYKTEEYLKLVGQTLVFLRTVNTQTVFTSFDTSESTNIIYFVADTDHAKNVVTNACSKFHFRINELPLNWGDLDDETKSRVLSNFVIVGKEKKKVILGALLKSIPEFQNLLRGDLLNSLLAGKTLSFFSNENFTEILAYFLDRRSFPFRFEPDNVPGDILNSMFGHNDWLDTLKRLFVNFKLHEFQYSQNVVRFVFHATFVFLFTYFFSSKFVLKSEMGNC